MKLIETKRILKICVLILFLSAIFNQVKSQPNFAMTGFATENGGTTGGIDGDTVTVNTYADLKKYTENSTPLVILVDGTITNGASGGKISINSNKSLIGIGSDAFLSGVGIEINGHSNIIIQNIKITMVGLTTPKNTNDGDCISILGSSKNIWIDHCEAYSEDPDVQTDIDKYDGLIDIKNQSGFITISWSYFHDHHKGFLVGSSDEDLYDDRKITYHHNYYNKVKLRLPMYRGSVGHFYNNYLVGAKDATEIRIGTCVRVERNYYEALHYSIYTPSDSRGNTERISNIEVDHASRAYPSNCTADIPYDYSDNLIYNTQDVKTIVPLYAGVGIIDNTVSNPPSVELTSPANNETFYEKTDIELTANASDNGSISYVEFFNGNKSLGADSVAPYSISWSDAFVGTYNIRAVATDNEGGTASSEIIAITVKEELVNVIQQKNNLKLDVNVYPVPVENVLNIEFNKKIQEFIDIHIYDLTGKKVKSVQANKSKYTLDLSGLPEGLYMIKVSGTTLNVVKQISKR